MPLPGTTPTGERVFLRDTAFSALLEAIQDGTLVPGDVLKDDELMEWLGMSRTPIRHAMIRLADAGLIEMSAGRQTTVTEISNEQTSRTMLVSGWLNAYAVRRVAGRLSGAQLAELAGFRREIDRYAEPGRAVATGRAIESYFACITRACGNRVLDEQVSRIAIELARVLHPGSTALDVIALVDRIAAFDDVLQRGDRLEAVDAVDELYAVNRATFVAHHREPEISEG